MNIGVKPDPEDVPGRPADAKSLAREILSALTYRVGKDPTVATQHDWLSATSQVARDRMVERWMASTKRAYQQSDKRVFYLSLEFLIGRLLIDSISNLGLAQAYQPWVVARPARRSSTRGNSPVTSSR